VVIDQLMALSTMPDVPPLRADLRRGVRTMFRAASTNQTLGPSDGCGILRMLKSGSHRIYGRAGEFDVGQDLHGPGEAVETEPETGRTHTHMRLT